MQMWPNWGPRGFTWRSASCQHRKRLHGQYYPAVDQQLLFYSRRNAQTVSRRTSNEHNARQLQSGREQKL